jgi:hypothetical protein
VAGSDLQGAEEVVRALAAAGRALRLYPPTSSIPRETIDIAAEALGRFFAGGHAALSLAVERDCLSWLGEPLTAAAFGQGGFVDDLRDHGVAQIEMLPGCDASQLLALLSTVSQDPAAVEDAGGIEAALAAAGVHSVRLGMLRLTRSDHLAAAPGEDVDEFLRSVANDPDKLTAWLAAAAEGDPRSLEEGLVELVRAAGPDGNDAFVDTLSKAFLAQSADGKDAILNLSMEQGPIRELTGGVFRTLSSGDIAGAVLGGSLGKNMLSLSSALTTLPLDQVTEQVRQEVQAMLPTSGHTAKEASFLEHMLEVRRRVDPEQPLIDADATYRAAAQAATLSDEVIAKAREAVSRSGSSVSAASVRTMLALLDQQSDHDLYCSSLDAIARVTGRLLEQGQLDLAAQTLADLNGRARGYNGPWPDLPDKLRATIAATANPEAMGFLARAATTDPAQLDAARDIVAYNSDTAAPALVAAAIALGGPGIETAEKIVGRQVVDHLAQHVASAPPARMAPVAARLAREGDSRSIAALESLIRRGEPQARKEAVAGVATVDSAAAVRILGAFLRDPAPEPSTAAARALGKLTAPGVSAVLASRLDELDIDGEGFELAREIITALARTPDPGADAVLDRLAHRKALIKRGHFNEVGSLARQAAQFRAQGGVSR